MEFKRCYGCMRELAEPGGVCPHCGFDNTNGPEKQPGHVLPCGTILNGQYVVGRSLGQGGFGITYIGYDLNLQLPVCIKEYFPEGAAMRSSTVSREVFWGSSENATGLKNSRESFVKESRKAVRLRDLNHVVNVWNVFFENETAYIVMDYIEGETLKSRLVRTQKRLSEKECISLLSPVIRDLEQVHARGIIHRDIKPDNLMLQPDGDPVLLDLGAAKDLDKGSQNGGSNSSTMVVSHGFSPLEQYRSNSEIGPWTDVYAMCATIYYCVTGKVLSAPLDRMEEGRLNLHAFSPAVAAVLEKGLAIKPEERIRDMGSLLALLQAAENGVMPAWDTEKSKNKPKPGRRMIPLGALAALLILIAVIGQSNGWWKAVSEKETPVIDESLSEASARTAALTAESGAVLTAESLSESTAEQATEEPTGEQLTEQTEEPTGEQAEEQLTEQTEEPTEEPIEEATEEPIEEPAEEPTEEPIEEPTEEPAEEPAEEPIEEPAEEPIEEPAEEPTEEPTEEPIEEPAEEPIEEPDVQAGDSFVFGAYEQDDVSANGKEEIEWLVLAREGSRALLISARALDAQAYNRTADSTTWATCSLRTWLNNGFLNAAFSAEEQEAILTTDVDNGQNQGNPRNGASGGSNTTDKIFLLSYEEAATYFSSDSGRICQPTAYAKSRGAKCIDTSGKWWLRSPGYSQRDACDVFFTGDISGSIEVDSADCCVRPALWVDLRAGIF